jgi:hypothetical protein
MSKTLQDRIKFYNNKSFYNISLPKTSVNKCLFKENDILKLTYDSNFYSEYLFVLGVVTIESNFITELFYLCKISSSTVPSKNSKGHQLSIINVEEVETNYVRSITTVLKQL